MPLQKECCSLEIARQLKTLGFEQSSLYYYVKLLGVFSIFPAKDSHILSSIPEKEFNSACKSKISAFTSSELGEMLPWKIKDFDIITQKTTDGKWFIYQRPFLTNKVVNLKVEDTEADARAKMLIYLKTSNLI